GRVRTGTRPSPPPAQPGWSGSAHSSAALVGRGTPRDRGRGSGRRAVRLGRGVAVADDPRRDPGATDAPLRRRGDRGRIHSLFPPAGVGPFGEGTRPNTRRPGSGAGRQT